MRTRSARRSMWGSQAASLHGSIEQGGVSESCEAFGSMAAPCSRRFHVVEGVISVGVRV